MKKVIKYSYLVVLSVIVSMMTACTDDYTYDKPAALEGAQVYFSNTLSNRIEINKDGNSFQVKLNRQITDGELTVPLSFAADEGNIYIVPTSVTFNDGESEAMITITYNSDDVEYGKYVGGTISFTGAEYETPYGASKYSFKAGASAWVDVIGEDGEPVKVTYREDLVTHWFSVDNVVYQVYLQESSIEPGMYRLVNPYGAPYEYNSPGDYDDTQDSYLTINAKDPDYVYIEESPSTMNWGYGNISFSSYVDYLLSRGLSLEKVKADYSEYFGKLENNVITMPAGAVLISMADYQNGSWYFANDNGLFAVALPGGELSDYSATAELTGRFTDNSDQDYATVSITLGEDVTTAKYALISADDDIDEAIKGIKNGTIESVEITENGEVKIPFDETGTYTLVIVTYKNGEAVGSATTELKLKSSHDSDEVYEDIALGTLKLGVKDLSTYAYSEKAWGLFPTMIGASAPIVQEAILSQSTSNSSHFKITPFYLDENPLYFTWDQSTNNIRVENVETGISNVLVSDFETDREMSLVSYNLDSYYDSGVFYFNLAYFAGENNYYAAEQETFEITTTAANSVKKAAKNVKSKKSFKDNKVNIKAYKLGSHIFKNGTNHMKPHVK